MGGAEGEENRKKKKKRLIESNYLLCRVPVFSPLCRTHGRGQGV